MNILIAEKIFCEKARKILEKCGRVYNFRDFLKNLPVADVVVTGLDVRLSKKILSKAPRLKLIATRTTQLRYIDSEECKRRNIKIISIKGNSQVLKGIYSTAEETFALIFGLVRNVPWAFESVKNGKWERMKYGGIELHGKTIGLIGFGRLAKWVSKYANAFGMKVISFDPNIKKSEFAKFSAKKVSLDTLLKKSDIVSIHCIYNRETEKMLRYEHFRKMKREAYLINTARGEIVDEKDLLRALKEGLIKGYATDSLAGEEPGGAHIINNPLVEYAKKNKNVLMLPHLGGSTKEATEKTQMYIAKKVKSHLSKHKSFV